MHTAQAALSGVGVNMNCWTSEKQFTSWLGLCPDHRISGGKALKRGTRRVVKRASTALRLAAWGLLRSQSAWGAKLRRLRSRLGVSKAITAMARLLARRICRMLEFGRQYVDKGMEHYETKYRQQQLQWVAKQAASLNMQLIPIAGVVN